MLRASRTLARDAALGGLGMFCAAAGMCAARIRSRAQRLRGQVVVITGGSRGLGLAMAEEFGRRGALLVLAARDEEELARAKQKLVAKGLAPEQDVLTIAADLRRESEAARLIDEATRRFGRVDVLVNNAGIITVGPAENQTAADFREVMEINFFAGLYCTLAVLPQMMARRAGAIANITSIGGKVAVPHLLPYTASKFAAVGFSEGLGAELRSKGIRVTTVVPGLMRTGSHRNAVFTGDAEREYRWFSLGASLPGASIAANRAARQIAEAVAGGAVEITITPQAFLAARFANLSPTLTRTAMQLMNLALPAAAEEQPSRRRGAEVRSREPLPARTIGSYAARRYNQTERLAG